MKNKNYGMYAIAVAIAFVGALWLGVPATTLLFLGAVLICPLMMFLMMRGMHGGDGHDQHAAEPQRQQPAGPYERSDR